MDLFLIRHAQSENNARPQSQRVPDPGLTPIGLKQADCLARLAPDLKLTRLITSPFRRTLRTTEPVARATGLPVTVWVELHELGGCVSGIDSHTMVGEPGMTPVEIQRELPGADAAEVDPEGWWQKQPYESLELAEVRARRLLKRIQQTFAAGDERVAMVMHADIKRIFLGCFADQLLSTPYNTSVTHVEVRPEINQLTAYNQTTHLANDLLTT